MENSATNSKKRKFFNTSISNNNIYPKLLEIQLKSFKEFFSIGTRPEDKPKEKLYSLFNDIFNINDTQNQFVLEFLDYFIDSPKYSIEECIERGLTYSVPIRVRLKLYCTDENHIDFETKVQDVYLGSLPYMTERGTFIINGAERVIISQLHRSPGVFFGQSYHASGVKLYSARVIPFKGTWIEISTDSNNVMYAYIDRKKKVPFTTLLRSMGYGTDKDILNIFSLAEEFKIKANNLENLKGKKIASRIVKIWHEDFVDETTGESSSIERTEILLDRDTIIEDNEIEILKNAKIDSVLIHCEYDSAKLTESTIIYNTLQKDPTNSEKEAIEYIYKQLRNTDAPDEQTAKDVINRLFFSDIRYSLGDVGRFRINKKLGLNISPNTLTLTFNDIISIVKYLMKLIDSKTEVDDIDHLSNRRVKNVGEQLAEQFTLGLTRMAKVIRERMNVRDNEVFDPVDLINLKTLTSAVNSFFGTSQLSQFMDQTNPLSEITHKRRLTALGPGGLSRERAGFEVRDVHYTHYGRLCPIETPEGPNIGLISSLSVFAKIDDMGFITTPYYKVKKGVIDLNRGLTYLTAEDEDGKKIGQSNIEINEKCEIKDEKINARYETDFVISDPSDIDYLDVESNQIASISASLIPFLEHDDANRALMGSNMMRQAVPLLKPESPIVGTGLESKVAENSNILINAEREGIVEYVDAKKIIIKYNKTEEEKLVSFEDESTVYDLIKFRKTNQNTTINLNPIVRKGEKVKKGQVLCEGFATEKGELALGRNLKVAFMPWKGYNFEDAIVISEKVVKEDLFTSLHIDEYSLDVRETKLGDEEFTSDIPNVSEEATKNLDENGIIRIGCKIKPGDILIGKITPKGQTEPTPEEKLLKAIFGDKVGDVKDASLRATTSLNGIVIRTKLYEKVKKIKSKKSKEDKLQKEKEIKQSFDNRISELDNILVKKIDSLLNGKICFGVKNNDGEIVVKKGVKYSVKTLKDIGRYDNLKKEGWSDDESTNNIIGEILNNYRIKYSYYLSTYTREEQTLVIGDELPSGINKLAKVFIAKKRKLQVGDKMAGRHGNKGIVAKIVREEDMPFLEDGTPVDIVLNPLGVPSRMNVGQIYETVLGWAGLELEEKYATPIFNGISLEDINNLMDKAKLPRFGRVNLYDGGTGEKFDQLTTVGVIYMLKLGHMIEDKMHARSVGPYSLITQQPLGGKAQFGGQRFGEMEVWALEAFGASNILREILTVKSDDVYGRAKTYESIVKGEALPEPGIPESFNVLLHELKGLGLDICLEK